MLEAVRDIAVAVRELNLGVGGFFALIFMAIFVWGAHRASTFAKGLSGEWRKLIEEGEVARANLQSRLDEAHKILHNKDEVMEKMRRDYSELQRRYYILEAQVQELQRRS